MAATPSVTKAVSNAFERMTLVLFRPFDVGKWFVLGFCAFLAFMGEGGFNCSNPFPGGSGPGPQGGSPYQPSSPANTAPQQFQSWVQAHIGLIIALTVVFVLLMFAIGLVLSWLKCRGRFMFIDGLVRNRGAIAEPWREFRAEGNSLFIFTLVFGFAAMAACVIVAAIALLIALPDIKTGRFSGAGVLAIIVGGGLMIPLWLVTIIITLLLHDFVVPVMYLRRLRVMEAWRVARTEVFAGRVGPIIVFYLMKIALTIGTEIAAFIATCATCCLPLLPYVGKVILLPIYVFRQCYSLCFLEQFGPQWLVFAPLEWPLPCPGCGGDLRGLGVSGACPNCGAGFVIQPLPSTSPGQL